MRVSQKFCSILVHANFWHVYELRQLKPWKILAVVGSIGISGAFDSSIGPYQVIPLQARVDLGPMAMKGYSALPKASAISVCNLKAAQMNVQQHLIQEHMLYECNLSHNATNETKNICCLKGEEVIDRSSVI